MSLQDRYIEQCTAEEVLSAIIDNLVQNPVNRAMTKMNEVKAKSDDILADTGGMKSLIGTPATGQPSTLFAAIAAGGGGDAQESTSLAILAKVQQIIDGTIISVSLSGYTFISGFEPANPSSLVFDLDKVISINDSSLRSIINGSVLLNKFPNVESVTYENLGSTTGYAAGTAMFRGNGKVVYVKIPNLYNTNNGYNFYQCSKLEELYLTNVTNFNTPSGKFGVTDFGGCPVLILIEIGAAMSDNFSLASWNPTTALSDNSATLVKGGETFSSNREKLLYNIREHIANQLRTDVGNKTITFHADVKAAIQADPITLAAFPSNWTIA